MVSANPYPEKPFRSNYQLDRAMETLKILFFNWHCWLNPAMGGAEVFTYENAKRWAVAEHEVTLFTSEFPNCILHKVCLEVVKVE